MADEARNLLEARRVELATELALMTAVETDLSSFTTGLSEEEARTKIRNTLTALLLISELVNPSQAANVANQASILRAQIGVRRAAASIQLAEIEAAQAVLGPGG